MDKTNSMLIFIIQGYEVEHPDGGIGDVCTIEVFAKTANEAMSRAKKIIKKKFYRIGSVIEKEPLK